MITGPRPEPIRFEPVGHCIYCSLTGDLSDEHVIPFGLDGNLILPAASCQRCAAITSRVERRVLHEMLGPFRSRLNLRTRRPKERRDSMPLEIHSPDGSIETKQVPREEFPALCIGYLWPAPGILRGVDPIDAFEHTEAVIRLVEDGVERHLPADDRRARLGRFDVNVFARMLAKIAHAYAVGQIGEARFEPLLLDLILERSNALPWLIGGEFGNLPREGDGGLHNVQPIHVRIGDTSYWLVAIQLFAMLGLPRYFVVVGRATQEAPRG